MFYVSFITIFSNSPFGIYRPQIELIGLIFTDFSRGYINKIRENQSNQFNLRSIWVICEIAESYCKHLSPFHFTPNFRQNQIFPFIFKSFFSGFLIYFYKIKSIKMTRYDGIALNEI
jgi:hypothetical protein